MPKDSGLFLLVACCCIVLILTLTDYKGYAHTVSDWSGVKCDYATNAHVANYYGNKSRNYRITRADYMEKFVADLRDKKSLTVGIDYYALYGVCRGIIPPSIIQKHGRELQAGKVFVFQVTLNNNAMEWREL